MNLKPFILLLCLPLCACPQGASLGGNEKSQGQLPQIKVKLPPPPSFEKEHAPEKYSDGTYSIYGVRKNMKDTLDKQNKIRAYVLEVYECPECPKGKDCPACQRPHLWISDRANGPKDKALMVVDYPKKDPTDPRKRKKMVFTVGVQYYMTGVFTKNSGTGFRSSEGLVAYLSSEPVSSE